MYFWKHLFLSKHWLALAVQSLANNGWFFICIIASANALRLPCSTTMPVFSSIASGEPPVLYVIMGVPQARASRLVVGKLSSYVGFAKTSAAEYSSTNSF